MDDERIWNFERELWVGGDRLYQERVSPDCLMALPEQPFLFHGNDAAEAVEHTPRWQKVEFQDQQVSRPQEGLIVIAYRVEARKDESCYEALCTTTLRRLGHEDWDVIQHQQTPLGVIVANPRQSGPS